MLDNRVHGFSLIELLVVLAIILLISSMASINTHYLNKAVVHTEIDLLYNTCCYLQHTAMATNQKQELSFDGARQSYSHNGEKLELPQAVQFGILPHVKGPPSSPSHVLTMPITFAHEKIVFYPDGIISSGIIYMVDSNHQDIYALSSGIANASFLRKYRYDGKWHLM